MTPPTQRLRLYREAVSRAAPRLLGMLDRSPDSPTAGSFDRDHWAWKFRDFPIGMLQMALLPLVRLHLAPPASLRALGSDRGREWIELGLSATLHRQHRNGSWDHVGPYTQDHGMTVALVHVLSSVGLLMGDGLPDALIEQMRDAVERACRFGSQSSEDYAFISNHQALFALGYSRAASFLGDASLEQRSDELVAKILTLQSEDGWYMEYGGPDPGYETLGILHLAELHRERARGDLARSIERSIDFLFHTLHPDGSVGGVFGSRHTRLWAPGGIELFAARFPLAESVAALAAGGVGTGAVPALDSIDAHNLAPLLGAYLTAIDALEGPRDDSAPEAPTPPCQRSSFRRHFGDSGLHVVATPTYWAVVATRKGGVGVVHCRATGKRLFEDAGYVASVGRREWASQLLGLSQPSDGDGAEVTDDMVFPERVALAGRFGQAMQVTVTPLSFLVLRALNLTVFRFRRLGALVRGAIMARLVTDRTRGPLRIEREIVFRDRSIEYRDKIMNEGRRPAVGLRLARSFQAIHMGSARYFSTGDVEALAPMGGQGADLGPGQARTVSFTVRFDPDGEGTIGPLS